MTGEGFGELQAYTGPLTQVKAYKKLGAVWADGHGRMFFFKQVNRERHFMRRNQSWAISHEIVVDLIHLGVDRLVLWVEGEGLITVSMGQFHKHSTVERWKDYEEQDFLHEGYWERVQ